MLFFLAMGKIRTIDLSVTDREELDQGYRSGSRAVMPFVSVAS